MDFLLIELTDKETLAYTALRYFLFPALLLIIGGVAVNIIYPRWQDRYLAQKAKADRRNQVGEDILALMNGYVVQWCRLFEAAEYAAACRRDVEAAEDDENRAKLEEELKRRNERTMHHAEKRSEVRDRLMDAISRFRLYCDEEARDRLREFCAWDESHAGKGMGELPGIDEWRRWEDRLRELVSSSLR